MAASKYIPIHQMNDTVRINWEKSLLKKYYTFIEINTIGTILYCKGKCSPSEYSIEYNYKLMYRPGYAPSVYTTAPKIPYDKNIHMYPQDNRLCLYYPKDFSWTASSHLYNTIIPWTHEWFLYYEIYKLTGKWIHPEVVHQGEKIL